MMAEVNNSTGSKNEGKRSINLILLIGLISFLITIIVAGIVLILILRNSPQAFDRQQPKQSKIATKAEIGPLVPIGPEIIVNITSDTGTEYYLKVNITLELQVINGSNEKAGIEEINKRIPQIRDTIITILRGKNKEKIDQKEGKDLISSEIISAVNRYLVYGRIKNVYFQDFVIQ